MTKGLVSVIIAAYNAEDTLPQCLDSVLNQTYRSLEIIVINDCSTDGTQRILDEYAFRDSRIILLNMNTNSGAPAARNKGMEISSGEYLTAIDADDTISPDAVESSVNDMLSDSEIDLIIYKAILVSQDGRTRPFRVHKNVPGVMSGEEACYWSMQWNIPGWGFSRSPLEQSMPAETTFGQYGDETTTHLIMLMARKVLMGKGRYYYHKVPSSYTNQISFKRFEVLECRMSLKRHLEELNVKKKIIKRFEPRRWKEFIGICYFFWRYRGDFSKEEQCIAIERLSNAYDTFHWRDLPLTLVLKPRFMLLPTFTMFYRQVSVVFALKLIRL